MEVVAAPEALDTGVLLVAVNASNMVLANMAPKIEEIEVHLMEVVIEGRVAALLRESRIKKYILLVPEVAQEVEPKIEVGIKAVRDDARLVKRLRKNMKVIVFSTSKDIVNMERNAVIIMTYQPHINIWLLLLKAMENINYALSGVMVVIVFLSGHEPLPPKPARGGQWT